MGDEGNYRDVFLLYGRFFLKLFRIKIDVYISSLVMEFDGNVIKFNSFYDIRYLTDVNYVCVRGFYDNFVIYKG